MAFDVVTITEPDTEAISLEEARLHLKVDHQVDDTLIERIIKAARKYVEQMYGYAPAPATFSQVLDQWPDFPCKPIYLMRAPVADDSVTAEVFVGGSWQTVAADQFFLDNLSRPNRVIPASNVTLPEPDMEIGGIRVKFEAGTAECPDDVRQAMFMLIGSMYENRSSEVVGVSASVLEHGLTMLMANHKLQPMC